MSNTETIPTQKKKEMTEMDQVAPLNKNILRLMQPRDSEAIINENNNVNNNNNTNNNSNKTRSSNCSNSFRRSNEEDDHTVDEYRISDSDMTCHDSDTVYPLPFLVRARTIEEKEAVRNEYRNSLPQSRSQTIYNDDDDDNKNNNNNNNNGSTSRQEKEPQNTLFQFIDKWYRKLSASKLLENKASVARDHLANERTFLAWLRTSLSLITVGVAITQLFHLRPNDTGVLIGRILGGVFVGLSIVFLYFANIRYFHIQYSMINGQFPASRGAVLLGSISVLAVLLAMFIVIVTNKI